MIRKIGYYCRKVLPTVLDDALSYYEQLCKVVLKCNEVIDVVNGVVESVDALGRRVDNNETDLGNLRTSVNDLDRGLRIVDEVTTRITPLAENALQKTSVPNVLYGTDGTGQKAYTLANGPTGFTVGLRDAGGVMRVGAPVGDYDAVNLKYFRENMGGSSAEMVLKKVRISAPSGSAIVTIDTSDLAGIVADTPIWVFYQMPNGETSGPPSCSFKVGNEEFIGKKFGDYPTGASAEVFSKGRPAIFRVFFDGSNFLLPYGNGEWASNVASGASITVYAYGNTITSLAYADIVYFKEG